MPYKVDNFRSEIAHEIYSLPYHILARGRKKFQPIFISDFSEVLLHYNCVGYILEMQFSIKYLCYCDHAALMMPKKVPKKHLFSLSRVFPGLYRPAL